jgi:hypothetical protein
VLLATDSSADWKLPYGPGVISGLPVIRAKSVEERSIRQSRCVFLKPRSRDPGAVTDWAAVKQFSTFVYASYLESSLFIQDNSGRFATETATMRGAVVFERRWLSLSSLFRSPCLHLFS